MITGLRQNLLFDFEESLVEISLNYGRVNIIISTDSLSVAQFSGYGFNRLDHLVSSSRQLDETVAELLDPPRELVDVSRLASRLLSSYQEPAVSRNLRIRADLQQGVAVRASEDLLETVLETVIDNAISVSKAGGDLQVDLKIYGRQAVLSVRDRGPGVPAQHLERIFERYVSMRDDENGETPAGSSQHRGIGLWIVRRNLEAVGGGVRAENAPGGGLRVIIRLPLAR